jgi:hypothetical protein
MAGSFCTMGRSRRRSSPPVEYFVTLAEAGKIRVRPGGEPGPSRHQGVAFSRRAGVGDLEIGPAVRFPRVSYQVMRTEVPRRRSERA